MPNKVPGQAPVKVAPPPNPIVATQSATPAASENTAPRTPPRQITPPRLPPTREQQYQAAIRDVTRDVISKLANGQDPWADEPSHSHSASSGKSSCGCNFFCNAPKASNPFGYSMNSEAAAPPLPYAAPPRMVTPSRPPAPKPKQVYKITDAPIDPPTPTPLHKQPTVKQEEESLINALVSQNERQDEGNFPAIFGGCGLGAAVLAAALIFLKLHDRRKRAQDAELMESLCRVNRRNNRRPRSSRKAGGGANRSQKLRSSFCEYAFVGA